MAQTGYTPIQLYHSTTSSAVPSSGNLASGELAINIANSDMALYAKNASGSVKNLINNPVGLKYPISDGTANQVIKTDGSGNLSWVSLTSGAAVSNDTSTASDLYPLFSNATTGTPSTIYTSNAKLLYKPSTGDLKASQMIATNGLMLNNTTVSASYTVPSGSNAMSVGPITVASGITVTVSSGQRWVVL